ncbi:MAG TPA: hypothetical protein VMW66_01235 [Elusimicrobiales bacterium]|nr:hypothetical protein [Elusimicrobiales bacterium]
MREFLKDKVIEASNSTSPVRELVNNKQKFEKLVQGVKNSDSFSKLEENYSHALEILTEIRRDNTGLITPAEVGKYSSKLDKVFELAIKQIQVKIKNTKNKTSFPTAFIPGGIPGLDALGHLYSSLTKEQREALAKAAREEQQQVAIVKGVNGLKQAIEKLDPKDAKYKEEVEYVLAGIAKDMEKAGVDLGKFYSTLISINSGGMINIPAKVLNAKIKEHQNMLELNKHYGKVNNEQKEMPNKQQQSYS